MHYIVQTADDLAALRVRNPAAYRAQLEALIGSSRIRTNQAEYPEGYDSTLEPGQSGYIAPAWVEIDDLSTMSRLGFADRAALEVALAEADA